MIFFEIDSVWGMFIAIMLAFAGGLAQLLAMNHGLTRRESLRRLFVSGFAGAMSYFIARELSFSGNLTAVFSGMSGWLGAIVLRAFGEWVLGRFGMKMPGEAGVMEMTRDATGKQG